MCNENIQRCKHTQVRVTRVVRIVRNSHVLDMVMTLEHTMHIAWRIVKLIVVTSVSVYGCGALVRCVHCCTNQLNHPHAHTLQLLAHVGACGFFLMADLENLGPNTWVWAAHMQPPLGSVQDQYTAALYWSMLTVCCVHTCASPRMCNAPAHMAHTRAHATANHHGLRRRGTSHCSRTTVRCRAQPHTRDLFFLPRRCQV